MNATIGRGISVDGGNGIGGAVNFNQGAPWSVEVGFTTPNASLSYTGMIEETSRVDDWYWRLTR
jgi:hypothetical protein